MTGSEKNDGEDQNNFPHQLEVDDSTRIRFVLNDKEEKDEEEKKDDNITNGDYDRNNSANDTNKNNDISNDENNNDYGDIDEEMAQVTVRGQGQQDPEQPVIIQEEQQHQYSSIGSSYHNRRPLIPKWTSFTNMIHNCIDKFAITLSLFAVRNPIFVITSVIAISVLSSVIGLTTNFQLKLDFQSVFTPINSKPKQHYDWIYNTNDESDRINNRYQKDAPISLIIHSNGNDNILQIPYMDKLFQAIETIQQTEGYEQLCSKSTYVKSTHNNGNPFIQNHQQKQQDHNTCRIWSATSFWDHNFTLYKQQVSTNQDLIHTMTSSSAGYDFILGNYETKPATANDRDKNNTTSSSSSLKQTQQQMLAIFDTIFGAEGNDKTQPVNENSIMLQQQEQQLVSAQSYLVRIDTPYVLKETEKFQDKVLDRLLKLQNQWKLPNNINNDDNLLGTAQIDFMTEYSYDKEFFRGMVQDLPLVPVVAILMVVFTCLTFYKHNDKLNSRTMLGFGSVITINFSIMTSYGLMFIIGVPYTTVTQCLPYLIFGVGLDDTFIITGTYFRVRSEILQQQQRQKIPNSSTDDTNSNNYCNGNSLDLELIIQITMKEVGQSITLTTITTMLAFVLGSISTIPGVKWMCFYAFTTILVDFIYQITFFISLIVMDEKRRIKSNGQDCCFWNIFSSAKNDDGISKNTSNTKNVEIEHESTANDIEEKIIKKDKFQACYPFKEMDANGSFIESVNKKEARKSTEGDENREKGDESVKEGKFTEYLTFSETNSDISNMQINNNEAEITMHCSINNNTIDGKNVSDNNNQLQPQNKKFADRFMISYSNFLLKPAVKIIVLVIFTILFGSCAYSTTLLTQKFHPSDYVPEDSYLKSFLHSYEQYTSLSVHRPMGAYFRFVNQSDPTIQQHMIKYIDDLAKLPQVSYSGNGDNGNGEGVVHSGLLSLQQQNPPFCWVRDFQKMKEYLNMYGQDLESHNEKGDSNDNDARFDYYYPMMKFFFNNMTLSQQLDEILSNPITREIYGQDIVRDDDTGDIISSRCFFLLTNLDTDSVQEQIQMLKDQRDVTKAQRINNINNNLGDVDLDVNVDIDPSEEWPFFAFDDFFFYWETFAVSVRELIVTIVAGIIALTVIGFLLMPHWTAVLFLTPLIFILYVNFLGVINFFGLHINTITYFLTVVSVGLLVDYLMHILLRYYETKSKTREEKVKETLQSMGTSILLGGLTTIVGVIPLAFSTTNTFFTVFLALFGIVGLGITHGLILLPVILSLVGPV